MDQVKKIKLLCGGTAFLLSALMSSAVQARTHFAAPEIKSGEQEIYPESRFGSPPARVNAGRPSKFSAIEDAENQETIAETVYPDEVEMPTGSSSGGRSPAGLSFSKNSTDELKGQATKPVDYEARVAPRTVKMEEWSGNETARKPEAFGKGVQEVALIASDLGYFPKTVFVNRDIPVRIFVTGASKNTLCIMMDSFQVKKQVRSQKIEEVVFTPNVAGKYRFYCPVNGMEGSLIVRELSGPAPFSETSRVSQSPAFPTDDSE